jgi:hypothetical protein
MEPTQKGLLDEEEIRQELIAHFHLEQMTVEDQNKILDKILEAILKTILVQTFDRLGESGMTEYERVMERAHSEAEIAAFLESKIPGYNVFVREIVADFKESLVVQE